MTAITKDFTHRMQAWMGRIGSARNFAPGSVLGAGLPALGMNLVPDSKCPEHPGMKQGPRASCTGGLNLRPKSLALLQLHKQPRSLARQHVARIICRAGAA